MLLVTLGSLGCSGAEDALPAAGGASGAGGAPAAAGAPTTVGGAGASAGGGGSPSAGSGGVSSGAGQASGGAGAGGTVASGGGGADGGVAGTGGGGAANGGAGGAPVVDQGSLPSLTLHLAGDSTVAKYTGDIAQEGWGQELAQFFITKVTVNNQALGGASVETFYTGRWKNITGSLKAGDYVMAAFGANDSGSVEGRHVEPAAFRARFDTMAKEVAAKQATFIIVTPSALQEWSGGKNGNQRLGPYVTVLGMLATDQHLPLLDLNARSLELLNQVGQEAAKSIYINGDKAHFTKQGATQIAGLVAQELGKTQLGLAAYLKR